MSADVQWFHAVQAAFPDEELRKRIWVEAHQPSQLPRLFEDMSRYVLSLTAQQENHQELPTNQKKRKLDDGTAQSNGTGTPSGIANPAVAFECKDVSVQIPARKKLRVQLVGDSSNVNHNEVRLVNPTTADIEHSLPAESIDQIFCLSVPDKQQRQSYFAVFPKPGVTSANGAPAEQILFTLNETSPPSAATSTEDAFTEHETYVTATQRAFTRLLQQYGKSVIVPDAAEFASAKPQFHRKGEKGYHVNAHRGSKEGYLFFLPTGILFGFKKPLAFYPFHAIESISYTSVLQRTFNLVIAATEGGSEEVKETEFSMLDQEDFQGIDEYVKRHGLNDASLAAGRRAKEYGVNKEKKAETETKVEVGAGVDVGADEDGLTELQDAEQELQDAEDEEEEDYEASGGESDGEGEESEEDEEDGEGYEEEGDEDAEGEEDGVGYEEDEM